MEEELDEDTLQALALSMQEVQARIYAFALVPHDSDNRLIQHYVLTQVLVMI